MASAGTSMAVGIGTIENNNPAPAFSVSGGASADEGDQLVFRVTRSNGADMPESVTVTTSDGTATAGRDYVGETQTLTFSGTMLTQFFTVQTTHDGLYDGPTPETVNVALSGPTGGASLAPGASTAMGAIADQDPAPAFSVANAASVAEGGQLVFVVSRSSDAQGAESVTVATSDGPATAGRDYVARTQMLTFSQGQLTQSFVVQTMDDGLYNGPTPETVVTTLSEPTGGASLSPSATMAMGGIADASSTVGSGGGAGGGGTGGGGSDGAPSLALSPAGVSLVEGDSGETDFVYVVTRTGDAQFAQTVAYGVAGSGASPADGMDFVGGQLPSGTLTFTTGQSTQTITVRVAGDAAPEPDEGFTVTLSGPNFGSVTQATATGTIVNDDQAPAEPAVSGLQPVTTNLQDPMRPFASATISDPTPGALDSITITPSGAAGMLAGAGLTTAGDGTYTLAFATSQMLTQELDALTFTPAITNGGPVEATSFELNVTSTSGASSSASTGYTVNSIPNQGDFGTTTTSATSPQGEVYALYEGLLGRAPDPIGGENAVAALEVGLPLDGLAQGILSSSEGSSDFKPASSDGEFVDQLYARVLGRVESTDEQAYWDRTLANGASRADVADSFVFSSEHLDDIQPALSQGVFIADAATSATARLYYGLLGRAPDAGSLAANTGQLDASGSLPQLAQSFLNSSEYAADNPMTPSNQAFVNALFANALGRTPDQNGYWTQQLDSGAQTRAQVAVGIVESPEAQQHLAGRIENGYHIA